MCWVEVIRTGFCLAGFCFERRTFRGGGARCIVRNFFSWLIPDDLLLSLFVMLESIVSVVDVDPAFVPKWGWWRFVWLESFAI